MSKELLLIKLGGSFISDKYKVGVPNYEAIDNFSKDLKNYLKGQNLNTIIFTGAGGFGHPVAKKYKNNLREGTIEIKKAVKKLNYIIVRSLNKYGFIAKSLEPDKISKYENNQLIDLDYKKICHYLDKNIVPVFHADLINDQKLGITILSMDKFLVDLALYFQSQRNKIKKAIFIGKSPVLEVKTNNEFSIIKNINKDLLLKKNIFFKNNEIDVSGGMKFKVSQCLRLVSKKINCNITDNLFEQGTLIT